MLHWMDKGGALLICRPASQPALPGIDRVTLRTVAEGRVGGVRGDESLRLARNDRRASEQPQCSAPEGRKKIFVSDRP